MAVDLIKILNKREFDMIDINLKRALLKLGNDMQGKNQMETMKILVKFNRDYLSRVRLSPQEERAMVECIMESLDEKDQRQFENMYGLIKKMQ